MLKKIRVVPLAAESLGVRSMCTYVETSDVRVLLDAGVSLCPTRFGLPPHPKEFEAIALCRKEIAKAAERAEVVTISHYHYDHHTPSFEDWLVNWTKAKETANEIYTNKVVLMKNPGEQINPSQRERAWIFGRTVGRSVKKLERADGKTFDFDKTRLRFSNPVSHGLENTGLGWVLMVVVECSDEKFLFAPDIQGPMSSSSLQKILIEKPQLLMIGGPPLYLSPSRVSENQIQIGLKNLAEVIKRNRHVILDHHILRDENWREKSCGMLNDISESGCTLETAAEFLGKRNSLLEATRKKLFEENPPLKEFESWMKLGCEEKRHRKPPI